MIIEAHILSSVSPVFLQLLVASTRSVEVLQGKHSERPGAEGVHGDDLAFSAAVGVFYTTKVTPWPRMRTRTSLSTTGQNIILSFSIPDAGRNLSSTLTFGP